MKKLGNSSGPGVTDQTPPSRFTFEENRAAVDVPIDLRVYPGQ